MVVIPVGIAPQGHQNQLFSVSKLHKKKINDVGKNMYLDVKQKIALAAKTDRENMALRQRISELDEKAVAREKSRADAAERKAQEQAARGDREEKRANDAENRLSDLERFISMSVHQRHMSIGTISRLLSRKQPRHWLIGRIAQH